MVRSLHIISFKTICLQINTKDIFITDFIQDINNNNNDTHTLGCRKPLCQATQQRKTDIDFCLKIRVEVEVCEIYLYHIFLMSEHPIDTHL